ncbi:MAG: WYL domain-containing protein [Cytophagales bacterium]
MPSHTTLSCYYYILEKIRNDQPSKKELISYLKDKDFKESERTIERYIEHLRYDFGMVIDYDTKKNQYSLNEEESIGIADLMKYLEMASTAEIITQSLKEAKDVIQYIEFDDSRHLSGIENLRLLLDAIKNKNWVRFKHESFEKGMVTDYEIQPYLLKEYQKRWYLIGIPKGKTSSRTFGIERIVNLKTMKETFKPKEKFNPKDLFKDIVGLVYSEGEVEKVVLSFGPKQSRYIKSLPIHSSQEVIFETNEETRIALYVKINYEFIQQILLLGKTVKVIEPEHLVKEIIDNLKGALDQYS